MRTASLRPDVPVEVDIRGRVFAAKITGEPVDGRYPIEPLGKGNGYRSATARQIRKRLCPECQTNAADRGGRCFECRGRSML